MNPQESRYRTKVAVIRAVYGFALGFLILWLMYRGHQLWVDDITRGDGTRETLRDAVYGTLVDLRTIVLFIAVVLLHRKLPKPPKNPNQT